ncbi:MAG: hypothetical protein ACRDJW_01405 [Thermomicrobiales bacterium]
MDNRSSIAYHRPCLAGWSGARIALPVAAERRRQAGSLREGAFTVYEFLALLSGVLVGLVAWQVHRARMRVAAVSSMSLAVGVLVATISGEIMESWAFALLATVQVAIAAAVTMALLARRDAIGRKAGGGRRRTTG